MSQDTKKTLAQPIKAQYWKTDATSKLLPKCKRKEKLYFARKTFANWFFSKIKTIIVVFHKKIYKLVTEGNIVIINFIFNIGKTFPNYFLIILFIFYAKFNQKKILLFEKIMDKSNNDKYWHFFLTDCWSILKFKQFVWNTFKSIFSLFVWIWKSRYFECFFGKFKNSKANPVMEQSIRRCICLSTNDYYLGVTFWIKY